MTVGPYYDLLSAFQCFFLFEGNFYTLTTYSSPLTKLTPYLLEQIDCFLILGNPFIFNSRKECALMKEHIISYKLSNIVMVINDSDLKD
mmetsp:Transcript_44845/g.43438  ORF Transcript_44845/g.43438 Transcript_44845/m.43438 type:complete len:89 (+) Transcript_44845:363-629(+)